MRMTALAFGWVVVLWPAGVFKLNLLRTLRFRWYDSALVESNLPWYRFYTTLLEQAPVYTFLMFTVVATALLLFLWKRLKRSRSQAKADDTTIRILPFALYALTVFVFSFKQRLVYIHHIADLFPALTVVAVSLVVVVSRTMALPLRRAIVVFGVVAVALSSLAAINPDPRVVGPQEHAGFLGIRDFLSEYPNARTHYYYVYAMDYYLPDARVESDKGRYWTTEKFDEIKQREYDFVVSDHAMFNKTFPSIDKIARALSPEYRIVHVVRHRRTEEPTAWIFGRNQ
jgi:hypothetical protein